MTRSERELLIQRYLSGEMTSSEEGDFFLQVALDKELRHDLQAQKTVESAFRKDRESVGSEHTRLRLTMAAMLAASAPASQPAAPPAPSASLTKVSGLARLAGRIGLAPSQWMGAAAAALVLTIASVLIFPTGGEEPAANTPASAMPRSGGSTLPSTGDAVRGSRSEGSVPAAQGEVATPSVNAPAPAYSATPSVADVGRRASGERRGGASSRAAASRGVRQVSDAPHEVRENDGRGSDDPDQLEKPRLDTLKLKARVRINTNGANGQ